MTTDIALTLIILLGAVVLFITERIRLDLTALLVSGGAGHDGPGDAQRRLYPVSAIRP